MEEKRCKGTLATCGGKDGVLVGDGVDSALAAATAAFARESRLPPLSSPSPSSSPPLPSEAAPLRAL
jgi:hypothetical protein